MERYPALLRFEFINDRSLFEFSNVLRSEYFTISEHITTDTLEIGAEKSLTSDRKSLDLVKQSYIIDYPSRLQSVRDKILFYRGSGIRFHYILSYLNIFSYVSRSEYFTTFQRVTSNATLQKIGVHSDRKFLELKERSGALFYDYPVSNSRETKISEYKSPSAFSFNVIYFTLIYFILFNDRDIVRPREHTYDNKIQSLRLRG